LPKPFKEVNDIANEFKIRIKEHFDGKFEYINKSD
ncbi:unnamed protein product, partial [marine sediment metagenome]